MNRDYPAPRGYEEVRALAKQLRMNGTALIAMAPQNDPFYCGMPAQTKLATWFFGWWERLCCKPGSHIRRIHYRMLDQQDRRRQDGKPYENTEGCWEEIQNASKFARYLGLIPAHHIVDHRNPDPYVIAMASDHERDPCYWPEDGSWLLPNLNVDLAGGSDVRLPTWNAGGYLYHQSDQPYLLETWVEKSTVDDVLLPVCKRLGINLIPSQGFQSITNAVRLLCERVAKFRKPTRILYVSDFDPAGKHMPVQLARQIEFWLPKYAPGIEVKLNSVILLREQVDLYNLTRIPIKEGDNQKGHFEAQHGEGAVELDALEARHPGETARLIERIAAPYIDRDLPGLLADAQSEANAMLRDQWDAVVGQYAGECETIRKRAAEIAERYQYQIADLNARMQEELSTLRGQMDVVRQAVSESQQAFNPTLPARPEPDVIAPDESTWLFDSNRSYADQLDAYWQFQGKPAPSPRPPKKNKRPKPTVTRNDPPEAEAA